MKTLVVFLSTLTLYACTDERHQRWESLPYTNHASSPLYCNGGSVACSGGNRGSVNNSINRSGNRGR